LSPVSAGPANPEQEPKQGESDVPSLENIANEADINDRVGTPDVTEESALQQALADASGGSDTDASRPELGGQIRSNSVKKPATFKAVSVTKNFLAKAVGSTPIAKSATDKGK
jgi:hypothetical protein